MYIYSFKLYSDDHSSTDRYLSYTYKTENRPTSDRQQTEQAITLPQMDKNRLIFNSCGVGLVVWLQWWIEISLPDLAF